METTIVVGYVESPEGRAAVNAAIEEADLRGAQLVIVNASRHDAFVDQRAVTDEGWKALERRLQEASVPHRVITPQNATDAADLIVDTAEEIGASLIVIGLRRRSAVGKLLLGSTAQRVLMDARQPVLAVRA